MKCMQKVLNLDLTLPKHEPLHTFHVFWRMVSNRNMRASTHDFGIKLQWPILFHVLCEINLSEEFQAQCFFTIFHRKKLILLHFKTWYCLSIQKVYFQRIS